MTNEQIEAVEGLAAAHRWLKRALWEAGRGTAEYDQAERLLRLKLRKAEEAGVPTETVNATLYG